ncbi:hypothetical protein RWV98_18285 [Agathobaculum sp. NTUH-O15-33]|uniref:hypothetical protein n=1 Tax=Agathobaculum sp. NTUH-O15-33 TaxID=3079302 RepID=UPI0029589149|nr:hypothetical protein [Agathobaculum sp. NTUH-O15-33]WNX84498.1 hypothetical protein RWV98_18285 [Agathobaculum sp. NTUH-O15-33]
MLIVKETTTREDAVRSVVRTHRLKQTPTQVKAVYRPFWLGRTDYQARERDGSPVSGTIVFLADARILHWSIIGVYKRKIADALDLRDHQVNFVATETRPEEQAEVLEALLSSSELPSRAKLYSSRRFLARTLKLGKIEFAESIDYQLIHRPYWEIEFQNRRGQEDVALVSRDDILIRKRV